MYLRKIDKYATWVGAQDDEAWAKPDDCPATIVRDFCPKGGGVSVYQVQNPDSEIAPIVAALAARKERIEPLAYVLLDEAGLKSLGLELKKSVGETDDAGVNAVHWDIVVHRAKDVVALAKLARQNDSLGQLMDKEVREALAESLRSKRLNKLKDKFLHDLWDKKLISVDPSRPIKT